MSIKCLISAIEKHFNAVVKYDDGECEYAKTLHITPEGFEFGFEMYADHPSNNYSLDSDSIENSIYLVGCRVAVEKMTPIDTSEISFDY